jgi:hypothetical protein
MKTQAHKMDMWNVDLHDSVLFIRSSNTPHGTTDCITGAVDVLLAENLVAPQGKQLDAEAFSILTCTEPRS